MKIELLYFYGCPSYEELLPRLRELVAKEGPGAEVELRRIETADAIVSTRTETVAEGLAAGLRPATLITFCDGLAISMRQFRSREEALEAA